jgi:hypothetical protein
MNLCAQEIKIPHMDDHLGKQNNRRSEKFFVRLELSLSYSRAG